MIERCNGGLRVTVPMTMANARGLLDAGRSALQVGEQVVDLSAVVEVDSSAIATMLGWLREADRVRSTLKFKAIPPAVLSLAEVYGVSELLPRA